MREWRATFIGAACAVLLACACLTLIPNQAKARNVVSTLAGGDHASFNGDGDISSVNVSPKAIAVSPVSGDVYLYDAFNNIRRLNPSQGTVVTLANSATRAPRLAPTDHAPPMVFSASGDLYFTDGPNLIKKIANGSNAATKVAGIGRPRRFDGDGRAKHTSIEVTALAFDDQANELYFIDCGSRIRKLTTDGRFIKTVAGTGKAGTPSMDGLALKVAIAPNELVFNAARTELAFVDRGTTVRVFRKTDGLIVTVAGTSDYDAPRADGLALNTTIFPQMLMLHPKTGELYFTDISWQIRKVTNDGLIKTVAGDGHHSFWGDGEATAKSVNPSQMLFDPEGTLLFIDSDTRIRTLFDGQVNTLAGTGNYRYDKADDALDTNINPRQFTISPKRDLFFIDGNTRIRVLTNSAHSFSRVRNEPTS